MQSLLVVYNDPSAVYQPGSQVSGTVEIVVEKKLKVEAVKLEIFGEGRSYFTQSEQKWRLDKKGKREGYRETHNYDEHITYIDDTLLLWTPASGSKFLTEGNHSIPFSFIIPTRCAPSYEGTFGYVRYHCKAKLDVPWGFDKKSKTTFTVMPSYSLDLNPQANCSAFAETTENIGFSLFKHGYVTFRASIPKRGFVAGEPLAVNAWISNGSSKIIQKIGLRIKQSSTYTAYSSSAGKKATTSEMRTVFALDKDISLQPHQTETFNVTTPIPVMPPTFNCPLISVKYELRVKVFTKGSLKNTLKLVLPLIIGTQPSHYFEKPMQPPLSADSLKKQNCNSSGFSQSIVSVNNLPTMPQNLLATETSLATRRPTTHPIPSAPPAEPSMFTFEAPPSYEECLLGSTIPHSQQVEPNLAYKC